MGIIRFAALCVALIASIPAAAQGVLNSHESIEIKASPSKVWEAVKDFDGLHRWHPMFSGSEIKSGGDNEPGTVRTMTVKDGPSFDEELLTFDMLDKKFTYRLIDPVPLPVVDYTGTFQVVDGSRGTSVIQWNSTYRNNSDGKMTDAEVIKFINGAFRVGLENVKAQLETK